MSETRDFVAERIMGFERKPHQGVTGWGDVNADGSGKSGLWCDWCNQRISYTNIGPCPKYPFPKFTLVDLMRRLGEEGCIPTMVRFDVLRKERRFTIADAEGRVCDTDNPLEDYCAYLAKKYTKPEQPKEQSSKAIIVTWDFKEHPDMQEIDSAVAQFDKPAIREVINTGCDALAVAIGERPLSLEDAQGVYDNWR